MEYKYEIVADHSLGIPQQLKLDADFADVIGKSLKVGLQMGYADEAIEPNVSGPLTGSSQLAENIRYIGNVNDYHIIKVAYPKQEAETKVAGGTTVVLNDQLAGAFLESIEPGMRLTPEAFADTGGRWVSARMQLKAALDIDSKTAALMGRFFTAVEKSDWVAFRDCISDHIQYIGGAWFGNGGDPVDASASSDGYSHGIGPDQLIATSRAWRDQYKHVRYVLDMSRCVMNETTAIVVFQIFSSENGVDYENALPAIGCCMPRSGTCTSIYQIEQGRIVSLQHMVGVENSVSDTAKLAEQDQTLRLTTGEGVQDPEAGLVYDRYFKALQAQDYDALFDIYDPSITMTSVVDETGRYSYIQGRDAVMANQKTRWKYWLETHGPLRHFFLTTHITSHTAQLRFQFAETGIEWSSMYTMSNYKITSIRHQRDMANDKLQVVNAEWAETFHS